MKVTYQVESRKILTSFLFILSLNDLIIQQRQH